MNKIYQKTCPGVKNAGFTLIELLVVVLIIGILAAVALPQYETAVLKSRYAQLIISTDSVRRGQDLYYLANGHYTTSFADLNIHLPGCEITASGSSCKAKDYYCTVQDGSANPDGTLTVLAACYLENPTLAYVNHPRGPGRMCYADANNKAANQVCQSLGGEFKWTLENLRTYLLP